MNTCTSCHWIDGSSYTRQNSNERNGWKTLYSKWFMKLKFLMVQVSLIQDERIVLRKLSNPGTPLKSTKNGAMQAFHILIQSHLICIDASLAESFVPRGALGIKKKKSNRRFLRMISFFLVGLQNSRTGWILETCDRKKKKKTKTKEGDHDAVIGARFRGRNFEDETSLNCWFHFEKCNHGQSGMSNR